MQYQNLNLFLWFHIFKSYKQYTIVKHSHISILSPTFIRKQPTVHYKYIKRPYKPIKTYTPSIIYIAYYMFPISLTTTAFGCLRRIKWSQTLLDDFNLSCWNLDETLRVSFRIWDFHAVIKALVSSQKGPGRIDPPIAPTRG